MDFSLSAADSQDLRLAQEGREKTRDSWFFLFWPLLGLRYVLIERFIIPERYYEVHCALDDVIPFLEWFVIPYGLWYVFIAGMHLYTYFFDKQAFQRYSRFLITAFSISTLRIWAPAMVW